MSMLVNGKAPMDPTNVPLASLVCEEENVDVNFIKSNNFNNNAHRNNFGNINYRQYGNRFSSKMPSEERISEVENSTNFFMQMQYEQNKLFAQSMGEQFSMLKNISQHLKI
jgi:hypothetical protein